ncbi:HU family DNA-binding protein [Nitrolancea hollandica]
MDGSRIGLTSNPAVAIVAGQQQSRRLRPKWEGASSMRKNDLIKAVAQRVQQPETQVAAVINAAVVTIEDALAKGEDVTISGFGTFRVSERSAREGRNPQTGEQITIPPRKTASFKPGSQLKRVVGEEATA